MAAAGGDRAGAADAEHGHGDTAEAFFFGFAAFGVAELAVSVAAPGHQRAASQQCQAVVCAGGDRAHAAQRFDSDG